MSAGVLVLGAIMVVLLTFAVRRNDGSTGKALERAMEQFAQLAPRMVCALLAAGFVAQLIPEDTIARHLGNEAGFSAVLVAAGAGLIVPAGPVIAFSIAAVFAKSGASVPALVAFITSWTLYAAHRIFIYEIPLLGPSFLRLRALSVAVTPLIAGLIGIIAGWFINFPQPGH